jgi:hypothetical protein
MLYNSSMLERTAPAPRARIYLNEAELEVAVDQHMITVISKN